MNQGLTPYWSMTEIMIWWISVPTAFQFVASIMFCRTLIRAIGAARDQHHRMTLQSPWSFFDRAFNVRQVFRMLAVCSLAETAALFSPRLLNIWSYGFEWSEIVILGLLFAISFSLNSFPFLGITLLAPGFRSPTQLMMFGCLPWCLIWIGLFLGGMGASEGWFFAYVAFFLFGWINIAILMGLYSTREGRISWFRFEN